MAGRDLTAARLRELLIYDPETGIFTWRVSRGGRKFGTVAGAAYTSGHILIRADRFAYCAHRLAWLYVHGEWPPSGLDHRDGVPSNNAIANLRPATTQQNGQNRKMSSNNSSGYRGVQYNGRRWVAHLGHHGKHLYLGTFKTAEEASEAYKAARRELYEFQPEARDFPMIRQAAALSRSEQTK